MSQHSAKMGALSLLLVLTVVGSGYGSYDEFLTCDKLYESRRTARVLDHIPCDMSNQLFCEYKGSAYPEHAIWRFKEENKALMKRMYGDVESSEVYREMRSNSLFRDDRSSRFDSNMITFNDNMFNGLQYNIRVGSGLAMVKGAKDDESPIQLRFSNTRTRSRTRQRGTESPKSSSTTHKPTDSRTVVTVETTTSRMTTSQSFSTTEPSSTATTIQPTTVMDQNTNTGSGPEMTTMTMMENTAPALEWRTGAQDTIADSENPTAPPSELLQEENSKSRDSLQMTEESSDEVSPPGADDALDYKGDEGEEEGEEYYQQSVDYRTVDYTTNSQSDSVTEPVKLPSVELEEESVVEQRVPEEKEGGLHHSLETPEEEEEVAVLEEEEVFITEEEDSNEANEDEEDGEDKLEPGQNVYSSIGLEAKDTFYSGESINACPVEEEVKAPFWANNTRNQVLALLNLYPFEQYIHMETCKYESKEMLCRPGCRCEQQYRLHRLLAFDPNNECRGIFSDWFRFPSHCICKCYNVPEQIIDALTRNPRGFTAANPGVSPPHNTRLNNHRMSKMTDMYSGQSTSHQDTHNRIGIPAVFPYEGRAAIMAEIEEGGDRGVDSVEVKNRPPPAEALKLAGGRGMMHEQEALPTAPSSSGLFAAAAADQLKVRLEETKALFGLDNLNVNEHIIELAADEHIDNSVDDNQMNFLKGKEGRALDDHFFYNQPIVEFKLPDGTVGTIDEELPRK